MAEKSRVSWSLYERPYTLWPRMDAQETRMRDASGPHSLVVTRKPLSLAPLMAACWRWRLWRLLHSSALRRESRHLNFHEL